MAIKADYISPSNEIRNATVRVLRIWGSKQESWNAWVGVFAKSEQEVPDEQFSVSAAYVDGQNPFDALYTAVAKLSFIQNSVHDVVTELNSKVEQEEVAEVSVPVPEATQETSQEVPEAEKKPKRPRKKE